MHACVSSLLALSLSGPRGSLHATMRCAGDANVRARGVQVTRSKLNGQLSGTWKRRVINISRGPGFDEPRESRKNKL